MTDANPCALAARFLALAPKVLSPHPLDARLSVGDHILNPDFTPAPGDRPARDAAVLIGIEDWAASPRLVLTRRTMHLSSHAGQVAFPGGRIDPGEGAGEAALREAQEEIGLDPGDAEIIGYLAPYLSRTGYLVHGVMAKLHPSCPYVANPSEVDAVFTPPLTRMIDPAMRRMETILFEGKMRHFYEIDYPGYRIWGVTAGIIKHMADTVLGPSPYKE